MDTADWEYTSFLVRLWHEPSEANGPEWLAQVEHIPSGEKAYLASLEELFTYIRGQLPGRHTARETPNSGAGGLPRWARTAREMR